MIKTWQERHQESRSKIECEMTRDDLRFAKTVAMEAEIDELRTALEKSELHIKHIGNDALRTENEQLRAELETQTKSASDQLMMDGHVIAELRSELAALKDQEPVAFFNVAVNETVGSIAYDFVKHKFPSGTAFYLAPGAQGEKT